jgi:hypothetical protein
MAKLDKRTKGALWLLIGPTGLLITTFVLYALVNWLLDSAGLLNSNALAVTLNIILFLIGVLAVVAWLPGIVAGIVLLASKK